MVVVEVDHVPRTRRHATHIHQMRAQMRRHRHVGKCPHSVHSTRSTLVGCVHSLETGADHFDVVVIGLVAAWIRRDWWPILSRISAIRLVCVILGWLLNFSLSSQLESVCTLSFLSIIL